MSEEPVSPLPPARGAERGLAAWLFALLFVSYAFFFQGGGWNANSRLDLTRALALHGSVAIDAYRENTGDWAFRDGHYYTNKAPGLSFLSAPVFAVAWRLAAAAPEEGPGRLGIAAYLTNLAVNALPAALLGVLMLGVLRELGVSSPVLRAALVIVWGLGTLALPYATNYYAHQPAAVFGFAAFAALRRDATGGGARARGLAAGACAGMAVLLEHSAVLVVAALAAAYAFDAAGRRRLGFALLGGLPFAALLAGYDAAAFGDPLRGGFSFANPAVNERIDGSLFGAPSAARMAALLFSPYRGLLWVSPLFVLAPFGVRALWRADRRAAFVCAAVPIGFLLLTAGFHSWHGGFAAGPRYLVPALPFLFVPAALGMLRVPALAGPLAALSIAASTAITAVTVELPVEFERPLFELVVPLLVQGHVSINTYGFDDRRPDRPWRNDFDSFNLGELVFPHRVASLAPLLLAQLALAAAALRCARRLERTAGTSPQ